MTDETTDNFWAAWRLPPEEIKPIFHRLYYDKQGNPLFYSQEDLPGNYIDIEPEVYTAPPNHVRVVDGKLVILKMSLISKLYPGEVGVPCHLQDVSIVVDELHTHIKWSLQ